VRGACYFMSRQPAEKLVAGVVTASAGNHAQAGKCGVGDRRRSS
jgi:threonine dehydratase